MRKNLKCALQLDQIEAKLSYRNIDGVEIHLYGDERDDFSLASKINKPIVSVHYPLDRCDVLAIADEFESEYAQKVFDFCKQVEAGLVIHAESKYYEVMASKKVDRFCDFIKEKGIILYVENCYRNIGAVEAIQIRRYLRARIGFEQVFSLLDTCHLMMSEMSFKYPELSFVEAIDKYKSSHFIIHLNDCIGSGEKETGGQHGTNFSHNTYLLGNILWHLKQLEKQGYYANLVLETEEEDYIHAPMAMELAYNIDRINKEQEEHYQGEM